MNFLNINSSNMITWKYLFLHVFSLELNIYHMKSKVHVESNDKVDFI